MFVDSLFEYIGPPNCVHYGVVEELIRFEDVDQSIFKCLYVLVF